jgi:predicted metal-dependent hydrolase
MATVAEQPYEMPTLPLFADADLADAGTAPWAPTTPTATTPVLEPLVSPSVATEPEVEIRVSRRRKKSAVSYWEGGRIVVVLPAHVSGQRRDELVTWLVERTKSRRPGTGSSDEMLARRAAELADRYVDGVRPSTVRWVTNQRKRWGSCTADTREIRLSHRLRDVPGWVLDAVLVHELTHLVHPNHSEQFHRMANRYPRQKEASLFLDGFAHGLEHN